MESRTLKCLHWKKSKSESHSVAADSFAPGQNTGVGGLSLLQGIFPTQESNWGLLHCRRILYQLSYQRLETNKPSIYLWGKTLKESYMKERQQKERKKK